MDYKALVSRNNKKKNELEEKLHRLKDLKTQKLNSQIKLNNSLADLDKKIHDTEEELNNIELEILKEVQKNSNINFSDPDVLEAVVVQLARKKLKRKMLKVKILPKKQKKQKKKKKNLKKKNLISINLDYKRGI